MSKPHVRERFTKVTSGLLAASILLSVGLVFPAAASAATVPYSLGSPAHIGWMFTNSSWDSKNGWNTTAGNTAGQGDHRGTDYYADDWNLGAGDADCGQEVHAPFTGNVIFHGVGTNTNGTTNGYGNEVIIQADANGNFAYRATHLQDGTFTTASHVNAGDYIGKIGKTGGTSTYCHLHSVLYKNIYSVDRFGRTGYTDLSTRGAVLGGTLSTDPASADTIFATPFYNDAYFPANNVSACATYSAAGVVLFNSPQCTGSTRQFTTEGFTNLTDIGWNDAPKSMYVQSGWSARVWQDINRGGSSVCMNGSKWDMSLDKYENGTYIVVNGQASISSIQLYHNTTCTATVTDTTAPTGVMTGPAKNSNQRGPNILLTANASDNMSGVAKVDFYAWSAAAWSNQQWIYLGTSTTAPYQYNWNVSGIPDSSVFVTIRVTDKAGNLSGLIWDPNWTSFNIDKTAPTGVMTGPAKNSTLTGTTVSLTANASDNMSGVSKVEFYEWSPAAWSNQTWKLVGTDTTAPYQYTWSISGFASTYVYSTIIVYDNAGNSSGLVWDPNWTVFNIQH